MFPVTRQILDSWSRLCSLVCPRPNRTWSSNARYFCPGELWDLFLLIYERLARAFLCNFWHKGKMFSLFANGTPRSSVTSGRHFLSTACHELGSWATFLHLPSSFQPKVFAQPHPSCTYGISRCSRRWRVCRYFSTSSCRIASDSSDFVASFIMIPTHFNKFPNPCLIIQIVLVAGVRIHFLSGFYLLLSGFPAFGANAVPGAMTIYMPHCSVQQWTSRPWHYPRVL